MFKIACADMGMDCPFMAEGMTKEEAMKALADHGMSTHAEEIKATGMTEPEMMDKMMSVMKEE